MAVRSRKTGNSAQSKDDTSAIKSVTHESDASKRDGSSHHHHHHRKPKDFFTSKRVVFILGTLIGVLAAYFTAQSQDLISMEMLNDISFNSFSEIFDDLRGKLSLDLLREARAVEKEQLKGTGSKPFAVGSSLRNDGLKPKYPIIMIPGVISTGLESWSINGDADCPGEPYFRRRLWGSWNMIRAMLLDKTCWLKHLMLDPHTGLDPENYKLRAAQGMEAADFFMAGYWLWSKILENSAALGYDLNNMHIAAYDWRLSYSDLERRDHYFSKLKMTIEESLLHTGEKTVIIGHSMGSQVIFYFFKWVEAEGQGFGNGGDRWVDDHIEAFVDISGSSLGTPKAIVALLSGEMKDTVNLNSLAVYGLEKFFSRRERADLLRTFGGIVSMLPKGGEAIWGNLNSSPDDHAMGSIRSKILSKEKNSADKNEKVADITAAEIAEAEVSYGSFIRFRDSKSKYSDKNLTVSESIDFLYTQSPHWFRDRFTKEYSNGLALTREEVRRNNADQSKWINPAEVALPYAPNMKIYCFYGVGKDTERSYYYQEEDDKEQAQLNISIASSQSTPVVMGPGDGTISLITHTMCHRWKDVNSKFNPAGIPVKIVEMLHQPDRLDIRGGAKTAEHVDILGRTELNELVLMVAGGWGDRIEENRESDIESWVYDIDLGE